jgi:hypothetical protein
MEIVIVMWWIRWLGELEGGWMDGWMVCFWG